MNLVETFNVNTCAVHRNTLVNGTCCYKCDLLITPLTAPLPTFTLPTKVRLCMLCCCTFVDGFCPCNSCLSCGRATRLPGVCLFCEGGIFNAEVVRAVKKRFPQHLLSCLILPHHDFIARNARSLSDARHILALIASYL